MTRGGTLLLVALLLPAGAVPAPPPRQSAGAILKEFKEQWERRLHVQALDTLQQLAAHDEPRAVDGLLDVLEDDQPALHPVARRVLGGFTRQDSFERLVKKGLGHRRGDVRAQVLRALAEGRPAGHDWGGLAVAALEDRDPAVRAEALLAVGLGRRVEALPAVLALTGDDQARVRQALPACLVRLVGNRCLAVLDRLARDEHWRVRLAALDALAELKSPAAVALLVEALEREPGRLDEDIVAHLVRLTGRDLGAEPERWRAFLATAPPDFVERADAARLVPARYAAGIRYHDIHSASRRFVLVTDLSSSMETREQRRVTNAREYAAVLSRLQIAVTEIARLLSSLDARHAFGLVTFRDDADAWRPVLQPATERTLRDAADELRRWHAGGGTNLQAGLARVFDMAEIALDAPTTRGEDLDSVFLLSDGAPTVGELVSPELLLTWVAERNRALRLRIHCIALAGDDLSRDFLRRLAELTGGQYVDKVHGG